MTRRASRSVTALPVRLLPVRLLRARSAAIMPRRLGRQLGQQRVVMEDHRALQLLADKLLDVRNNERFIFTCE